MKEAVATMLDSINYGASIVIGDVYISIMVPRRMYEDEYKRQGLSMKNLSRALEDGACVSSSLIPWNACGAYMGFTGITMEKMSPEEQEQAARELTEKPDRPTFS